MKQFALRPDAVAVGQQAADDAGAFAHENIPRLKLIPEVASGQTAAIHEQTFGPQIHPAIQIHRRQTLLPAKLQQAGNQFGGNQQRRERIIPSREDGFQLRDAGFQGIHGLESSGLGVQLQLNPRQFALGNIARRCQPSEFDIIRQQLPEVMKQLAFVANQRTFTEI